MKKLLFFLAFFSVIAEKTFSQEEPSSLQGKIDINNKKSVEGNVIYSSLGLVTSVEYSDNIWQFYFGKKVSAWYDDKLNWSIMPGITYCDENGQFLGSLQSLFRIFGKTEAVISAKYFKSITGNKNSIKGRRAIFSFDGEITRNFFNSENTRFGLGLGASQSKIFIDEGIYSDRMHAELVCIKKFKWSGKFSFRGILGYEYLSNFDKILSPFPKDENNVIIAIGFKF